jgi:MFS family permease
MTALWRHRGFLHLWGAQATSTFGTRIGREAIQLSAVMLLGSGPLDLAWLNVAVSLPYLLFGLVAGILIDRMRRRPLLIATDLVRAALLATIPFAAWIGAFSLTHLLVAVFLVTACTLIFDAAHQTYVPTLIEKHWLLDANAKQESTAAASEIVGPPIGGVLVQALGAPIAILCDAVSYVASAFLLWRLPHEETPPEGGSARVTWNDLKVGFLIVFRHRLLRPLAFAKIIRAICGGAIGAFYVLYVFRDLQVSPAALGIVVGCGGASALAAALSTTRIAAVTPAGTGMVAGIAAATPCCRLRVSSSVPGPSSRCWCWASSSATSALPTLSRWSAPCASITSRTPCSAAPRLSSPCAATCQPRSAPSSLASSPSNSD